MKKKVAIVLLLVVIVAAAYLSGTRTMNKKEGSSGDNSQAQTETPATPAPAADIVFVNPKKGAHFESSTPSHGATLAASPAGIVIDFNFDLASNSTIKIEKDGRDYGTGSTTIDNNKLAMRRGMAADASDGLYTVNYNGCWPDRSCHDGHFQFAVNRQLLSGYQDLRSEKDVTIHLSQTKFQPMNIRLSKNTKVTWVNDDSVEHYVNTDSHPAHTHTLGLNSRALAKGSSFAFTFANAGAYPYHCSAHASQMTGSIVVE